MGVTAASGRGWPLSNLLWEGLQGASMLLQSPANPDVVGSQRAREPRSRDKLMELDGKEWRVKRTIKMIKIS